MLDGAAAGDAPRCRLHAADGSIFVLVAVCSHGKVRNVGERAFPQGIFASLDSLRPALPNRTDSTQVSRARAWLCGADASDPARRAGSSALVMGLTWPKAWRHRTSSPGKAQAGRRRTSKDDFLVGQRRRTEQPDPPGKVSVDDFELLSVIGKGSFAKVLQVRKVDTGKIYAMKVTRRARLPEGRTRTQTDLSGCAQILNKRQIVQRRQVAHTRTERNVLADVVKGHPFLVTLRYAFQTPAKLYLVLDYVNGGELFYWLKVEGRFQEDRACFYAAQIVLALEHLHLQGIIYRDLKPENILLDRRGYLRVTDFGLSKVLEPGEKTYSFVGVGPTSAGCSSLQMSLTVVLC